MPMPTSPMATAAARHASVNDFVRSATVRPT